VRGSDGRVAIVISVACAAAFAIIGRQLHWFEGDGLLPTLAVGALVALADAASTTVIRDVAAAPVASGQRPAAARRRLAELVELRAAGLLTDDEYVARRASALGLPPPASG
jgi:hypothetical protein